MISFTTLERRKCQHRFESGQTSQEQKGLAVEAEVRSAQHKVLLEAARLVLTGEPIEIARQLRDQAERTIRPRLQSRGRRT